MMMARVADLIKSQNDAFYQTKASIYRLTLPYIDFKVLIKIIAYIILRKLAYSGLQIADLVAILGVNKKCCLRNLDGQLGHGGRAGQRIPTKVAALEQVCLFLLATGKFKLKIKKNY